jgi:1,4-alpha-glucan branching enzyme
VPRPGFYQELLNTDAGIYGGSDVGNAGGVYSEVGNYHGQGQYLSLTLPPLGMLVLKPVAVGGK